MRWRWPVFQRKVDSPQRRSLRISIYEGIPAVVLGNIIGGPFVTAYLLHLGASPGQVGIVAAIPPLANIVQILVAFYMQKFVNRKAALLLTAGSHRAIWLLTGFIPFVMPSEYWVAAYLFIFFLSFCLSSASGVIFSSLIADMVPTQIRGRYFGIRNTIHWAAGGIALLASGYLLEWLPGNRGFVISYIIGAVLLVWNLFFLAKYPNPPFEKSKESTKSKMFMKPVRDSIFMKAVIFISVWVLLQNIVIPLFSFIWLDILNMSYKLVTILTMVQTIIMMFSYYVWGNLNARYSTQLLLLVAFPIIAVSCLVWVGIAFLPLLIVMLLVNILLGIGLGGFNMLAFNFIIGDTPKSDRPMYVAVYSAFTGFTGFIGPVFGGYLFGWIKPFPNWISEYGVTVAVGALLAALVLFFGKKSFQIPA